MLSVRQPRRRGMFLALSLPRGQPSMHNSIDRDDRQSGNDIVELRQALRDKEKLVLAQEAVLRDLKNQAQEKDALLISREAELHSLKFRVDDLSEQISQIGKDKDRMISEVARLNAELKEKKLILARHETEEWQSIGWRNGLKRRLGKLGSRFAGGSETDQKKTDESFPLISR